MFHPRQVSPWMFIFVSFISVVSWPSIMFQPGPLFTSLSISICIYIYVYICVYMCLWLLYACVCMTGAIKYIITRASCLSMSVRYRFPNQEKLSPGYCFQGFAPSHDGTLIFNRTSTGSIIDYYWRLMDRIGQRANQVQTTGNSPVFMLLPGVQGLDVFVHLFRLSSYLSLAMRCHAMQCNAMQCNIKANVSWFVSDSKYVVTYIYFNLFR